MNYEEFIKVFEREIKRNEDFTANTRGTWRMPIPLVHGIDWQDALVRECLMVHRYGEPARTPLQIAFQSMDKSDQAMFKLVYG